MKRLLIIFFCICTVAFLGIRYFVTRPNPPPQSSSQFSNPGGGGGFGGGGSSSTAQVPTAITPQPKSGSFSNADTLPTQSFKPSISPPPQNIQIPLPQSPQSQPSLSIYPKQPSFLLPSPSSSPPVQTSIVIKKPKLPSDSGTQTNSPPQEIQLLQPQDNFLSFLIRLLFFYFFGNLLAIH